MAEILNIGINIEEAGTRLDKWLNNRYPNITQGLLQKHLRKGFIRVNGKKATADVTVKFGDIVRIHPVVLDEANRYGNDDELPRQKPTKSLSADEIKRLHGSVIYKDENIIAINKPSGLAVQGGTGVGVSLDDMLDSLKFDANDRPRLVHRLDKDTSGVLLLARNKKAAAELTKIFREKNLQKIYWAAVVGKPAHAEGKIDLPISKKATDGTGEQMVPDSNGQKAVTLYKIVDFVGKHLTWLALVPVTGRTHQLRVHCAAMKTPILGDGKYGGASAFISGMSNVLHLHARSIALTYLGKKLEIQADLPPHMQETWQKLGFQENRKKVVFITE